MGDVLCRFEVGLAKGDECECKGPREDHKEDSLDGLLTGQMMI